jgi:hypothetical protein
MHPVLVIGILLAGACLWLLLSFLYKPIGWVGQRLANDAKHNMLDETKTKKRKSKRRKHK